MGKIISSPIGEIRGKVAGYVFARNQFGMYVRAHILPVNTNTVAQRRSRSLFATAAQAYCTLTPAQKAGWAEFARDPMRFNPFRFMNMGNYGGFHAFVSLYVAASKADAIRQDPSGLPTHTCSGYLVTYDAPAYGADGLIKTTTGNLPLRLVSAEVSETGRIRVTLTVDGEPPGSIAVPAGELRNGHNVPFGIGVWISTYVKNPRNRPSRDEFIHLGNTCIPVFPGDSEIAFPLTLEWNSPISGTEYRYGLVAGSAVRITVAQVGINGQLRKLGAYAGTVASV
jgi:hypothetical protein